MPGADHSLALCRNTFSPWGAKGDVETMYRLLVGSIRLDLLQPMRAEPFPCLNAATSGRRKTTFSPHPPTSALVASPPPNVTTSVWPRRLPEPPMTSSNHFAQHSTTQRNNQRTYNVKNMQRKNHLPKARPAATYTCSAKIERNVLQHNPTKQSADMQRKNHLPGARLLTHTRRRVPLVSSPKRDNERVATTAPSLNNA